METIELRYTKDEKLWRSLGCAALLILWQIFDFFFGLGPRDLSSSVMSGILISVILFLLYYRDWNRRFLRFDAEGLIEHHHFGKRHISWQKVNRVWVKWPLENNMAMAHNPQTWNESITFVGDDYAILLRIKFDFGPVSQRMKMRDFLEEKFGARVQNSNAVDDAS